MALEAARPGTSENRGKGRVPAVERAVAILRYLAEEGSSPATLTRIAGDLDLNPSTAYNILRTLTAARFCGYDPSTKCYELGLALPELAAAVDAPRLVADVLAEGLESVVAASGHTSYVFGWRSDPTGDGFVVVARRDGSQAVRMTADVGQRFEPNQRICAKTFFAWWPVDDLDRVVDLFELAGQSASATRSGPISKSSPRSGVVDTRRASGRPTRPCLRWGHRCSTRPATWPICSSWRGCPVISPPRRWTALRPI